MAIGWAPGPNRIRLTVWLRLFASSADYQLLSQFIVGGFGKLIFA